MGVIRNLNSLINQETETIEEILENLDNVQNLHEEEENIEQEEPPQPPRIRRVRRIRQRTPVKPEHAGIFHGRKVKGAKKSRRFENVNYLLSMADGEESTEVTIYDFIPESVSGFAQLLMERENMKLWNDFINSTDEEQQEYLDNLNGQLNDNAASCSYSKSNDEADSNKPSHPAFSSELCFKNIDSGLRYMLRHQHVPLGTLSHIEEDLASFFFSKPQSVYHSCLPTSFERLILHACSQYLNLICKSYNKCGKRWSQVSNQNETFARPDISLTAYLELKRNSVSNQEKC